MLTMRHAGKKERKRKWREKAREVHTIKEITLSESRKAKERQNGGLWPPITPTVSQVTSEKVCLLFLLTVNIKPSLHQLLNHLPSFKPLSTTSMPSPLLLIFQKEGKKEL